MARLAVVLIHIALTTVLTFSADALAEAFPTVEPADPEAETVPEPSERPDPEVLLPQPESASTVDAGSAVGPVF
jgi:hypothetical protein